MNVKEPKTNGLSHELEITIPANDIDKRVDQRLQEVSKNIRMPGFRPGKVPLAMLKKRYGKAIMGEVLEIAVNETSAKALKEKDLRPAMQPKIEVKTFDDGKDLVYTMVFETLPSFKIADFKSAKLVKPVAKPDDKSIQDSLERLAESRQGTKEITTKRGAKDGDTLVIDFDGRTAHDNVHHQGMKAEDHHLKLGSGQFIPGFETQLIGAKAGDKVEVKVTFPENYGASELAGKDAIFDVELHQIREPAEAAIDDELAKGFGLDTVEELKKAVTEQLQRELDQHSKLNLKKGLLDFLDDAHKFEIPVKMLELEFDNIMHQIDLDRKQRGEEDELSKAEKDEFREIAERCVRLGLILSEIGRQNNIAVVDAELQRAVVAEAQKYPGQEKAVFDYYSKNRNALESLRAPIYEDKVCNFIIELAQITEKDMTPDELMAALEDEGEEKPKKKAAKRDAGEDKPEAKKKTPAKKKA